MIGTGVQKAWNCSFSRHIHLLRCRDFRLKRLVHKQGMLWNDRSHKTWRRIQTILRDLQCDLGRPQLSPLSNYAVEQSRFLMCYNLQSMNVHPMRLLIQSLPMLQLNGSGTFTFWLFVAACDKEKKKKRPDEVASHATRQWRIDIENIPMPNLAGQIPSTIQQIHC